MSTREAVQTILNQLPSDVSLHEVAREIEFIAAVREGVTELDRSKGIPIDQVRSELPTWVTKQQSHGDLHACLTSASHHLPHRHDYSPRS